MLNQTYHGLCVGDRATIDRLFHVKHRGSIVATFATMNQAFFFISPNDPSEYQIVQQVDYTVNVSRRG